MRRDRMKLTVLIENKAEGNLSGEHGLCVHVEFKGKQYLLDSGASDRFQNNAKTLGIALKEVDTAVLSHAHYDHSGGYNAFFSENRKAIVYLQGAAKEQCYAKVGPFRKYIGIPEGILEAYSNRFTFVDGDHQLDEGVSLISHRKGGWAERGKKAHMYRNTEMGIVPDDFQHEQSLVFETGNGLVILNSCCHGGVLNIIEEVTDKIRGKEVLAVIGGFHLMGLRGTSSMGVSEGDIRTLGRSLTELGVKQVYTGHCTGDPAYRILEEELGERLRYLRTGTVIEF